MASTGKNAKKNTQTKQPVKQTPPPNRGIWREFTGVILILVGLILLYFIIANSSSVVGESISGFLKGVAGVLRILVPIILCWAGIMFIFSGRETVRVQPGRVALMSLIPLFVFTMVHAFSAEAITRTMRVYTFTNFVSASTAYTQGGAGFIGSLLTWPLYRYVTGQPIVITLLLIMLSVADLVLLGKISLRDVGIKVQDGFQQYRAQQAQNQQTRISQSSDFVPWENEPDAAKPAKAKNRKEPEQTRMPREILIERITTDDKLPGEPVVPPISMNRNAPISDVPDYLLHSQSARKQKKTQAESVRFEVPEAPVKAAKTKKPETQFGETPPPLDDADAPEEVVSEHVYTSDFVGDPYDDTIEEDVDLVEDAPEKPAISIDKDLLRSFKEKQQTTAEEVVEEDVYNYPPIDLLEASKPSKVRNQEQMDQDKADKLIETLKSFGINATLIGIAHGPTVTRFELSPAAGVKVSRITSLADDIALNLAAVSVRIEAPIPGKAAVGVEVPNDVIETVPLRDVLESGEARKHPSRIAAALGRDNAGRNIVADLAKMPHMLIAGATGAGKSVCINCIICSILYRATPEEVKLIMIDPKVVELSVYNGIPHLLVPVVTDPKKAASALDWAVQEMLKRYKMFSEIGVRDMKGYNQRRAEGVDAMPQIVIIIDELADLMMVTPGEVEDAICRLAQLARAAGIHLVIATQRPSVNVITGVIKANIPSRIAFTVASQVDSRTILDTGGAEKLLGRGDMLFAPSGTNKPLRVQGAWISEEEVHSVVEYIKVRCDAAYDEDIIEHMNNAEMNDEEKAEANEEYDDLLPQAIEIVIEAGQASISMLQRKLRVGYARAGRLIDEMAVRGIVSQAEGAKPRNVLISREQYRLMFDN